MSRWTAVMLGAALGLGLLDFLLRMPGWLRLAIGMVVVAPAVVWLFRGLKRAWGFRPTLSQLALRAERLYPPLTGRLASAVELSAARGGFEPATARLAAASIEEARGQLKGVRLSRLIDPFWTTRLLVVMVLVTLAVAIVVTALPDLSVIAASRWLNPLGDAQWPRRTEMLNLTTERVWPIDTPLRLRARVRRGYRPGMRVWVRYRLTDISGQRGDWHALLLSEQASMAASGTFERLIDLPDTWGASDHQAGQSGSGSAAAGEGMVEYYFEAGDDQTEPARVMMVRRPAVTEVLVRITAPSYATGLFSVQTVDLYAQNGQLATAAGLVGSTVRLDIGFNKSLPIGAIMPELMAGQEVEVVEWSRRSSTGSPTFPGVTLTFNLAGTVTSPIRLVDEHELLNLSERRYRIEAIEDKPPVVSLLEASSDASVLATAVIPVEALAQDDVGLEHFELRCELQSAEVEVGSSGQVLADWTGRQAEVTASATLELADIFLSPLEPGDVAVLYATAGDVFELDGERHEIVRSGLRRMRIVDVATLVSQIRNALASVREQAIRLEHLQRRIAEWPPDRPPDAGSAYSGQQPEVTRRMRGMGRLVDGLKQRADRNRLEAPRLREWVDRAADLIWAGRNSSSRADRELKRAAQEPAAADAHRQVAKIEQQKVEASLRELVALLDQGREAAALQLRLQQLRAQQEHAAAEARQLMPQTIGRSIDKLAEGLRQALRMLAERQVALSAGAQSMVRQMRSTAESMARQGHSDHERAVSEALVEAAAVAQRQGLSQSMKQAAGQIGQNRLSQAGQSQIDSLATMQQMLAEMASQAERMQEILRRRLRELVQAIEQLVEQQERQIERLAAMNDDTELPRLEDPQRQLRRHTLVVEQKARSSRRTIEVAETLAQAVIAHGEAVLAIRKRSRQQADLAEHKALEHLNEALRLVRQLSEDLAQEQVRRQRQQLKERYEELADRQDDLRDQTLELAPHRSDDHRRLARLARLADEESDLRAAASDLGAQVGQTLVFRHLHHRVDDATARIARTLRQGEVEDRVLREQAHVSSVLRAMATALDLDLRSEPFAGGQAGQGGGGGTAPPLVPPVAELKLLRGVQQDVYDQTRQVDEGGTAHSGLDRSRLMELSSQQRELAILGEQLIQRLQHVGEPVRFPLPRE